MDPVLVVEDEPGACKLLEIMLRRAGLSAVCTDTAEQGARVVESQPVSLIILDDMLPGMRGSDWCALLKADPRTRPIPVLIYSAYYHIVEPGASAQVGADAVLSKPSSIQDILAVVQRLLAASRAT